MFPTRNMPFACARYPHPPTRRADDIAEGVMNVVRTATIAYRSLADNKREKLNWCGHGFKGKKTHLFEFDKDNNIVWKWADPDVNSVTTVQVLK